MPILTEEAQAFRMPRLLRAKQRFDAVSIPDLEDAIAVEFRKGHAGSALKPGWRVAIAVGSRGIHDIDRIVRCLVALVRSKGSLPFIVPSMGSHGGATAEGQTALLAGYGITEDLVGAPVVSSMEVAEIGKTPGGVPVYFDKAALGADAIIPVARVKPHTDFRGPIESGLCKMLAIGLAKHVGCSRLHREGFSSFSTLIPEAASVALAKAPVLFGLAIVENARDETTHVEAVPAGNFLSREPELLALAKRNMPRILAKDIHVLVIGEIGKDISGAGMDPNIVGRTTKGILAGFDGPSIQRIVVLGLTEATHGNAIGIGLADFTVTSILDRIDRGATFANSIASGNPEAGRIPIALDTEDEAVAAALSCSKGGDFNNPRIVRIRNTLSMGEIEISEAIAQDPDRDPRLQIDQGAIHG